MKLITFRRFLLDQCLIKTEFYGKVLDIGGKRNKKRGTFLPTIDNVDIWEYVNIDSTTDPDYCCSAESIPVCSESYDIILMTEVLEHLKNPEKVLIEVERILKPEGHIIASIPFLYPMHADPFDYQRWTKIKIKTAFENAGFSIMYIEPVGSILAVFYDLLHYAVYNSEYSRHIFARILRRIVMPITKRIVMKMDAKLNKIQHSITTGYYLEAVKKN